MFTWTLRIFASFIICRHRSKSSTAAARDSQWSHDTARTGTGPIWTSRFFSFSRCTKSNISFTSEKGSDGYCKEVKKKSLKDEALGDITLSANKLSVLSNGKILALSNNGKISVVDEKTGITKTRLIKDPHNVFGGKTDFKLNPIQMANKNYTTIFDANIDGGAIVIDNDGEVIDRVKDSQLGADGLVMLKNGNLVGADGYKNLNIYYGFNITDEKVLSQKEIACDKKSPRVKETTQVAPRGAGGVKAAK